MIRHADPSPSLAAVIVIAGNALINLARGGIHIFVPDGGAGSIAGLDIAGAPEVILFLFAAIGVSQVAMGALDLYAVARLRALVLPLVVVHFLTALMMIVVFVALRPLPRTVPGEYGQFGSAIVFGAILAHEVWRRARPS